MANVLFDYRCICWYKNVFNCYNIKFLSEKKFNYVNSVWLKFISIYIQ